MVAAPAECPSAIAPRDRRVVGTAAGLAGRGSGTGALGGAAGRPRTTQCLERPYHNRHPPDLLLSTVRLGLAHGRPEGRSALVLRLRSPAGLRSLVQVFRVSAPLRLLPA